MRDEAEFLKHELLIRAFGSYFQTTEDPFVNPEVFVSRNGPEFAHTFSIGFKKYLPCATLAAYKWPKDWREAVKERFAPRWFINRWPVRYETVDVQQAIDAQIPWHGGSRFMIVRNGTQLESCRQEDAERGIQ